MSKPVDTHMILSDSGSNTLSFKAINLHINRTQNQSVSSVYQGVMYPGAYRHEDNTFDLELPADDDQALCVLYKMFQNRKPLLLHCTGYKMLIKGVLINTISTIDVSLNNKMRVTISGYYKSVEEDEQYTFKQKLDKCLQIIKK